MGQVVHVIDSAGTSLIVGRVDRAGRSFTGTIEQDALPPDTRRKFEQFEDLVNGQVFSLVDDLEDAIAGLPLRVLFEDGTESPVEDLQVFPRAGTITFRLSQEAVVRSAR